MLSGIEFDEVEFLGLYLKVWVTDAAAAIQKSDCASCHPALDRALMLLQAGASGKYCDPLVAAAGLAFGKNPNQIFQMMPDAATARADKLSRRNSRVRVAAGRQRLTTRGLARATRAA